jgi:hypothetical protein
MSDPSHVEPERASPRKERGTHMKIHPQVWILIALLLIVNLSACILVPVGGDGDHHGDYHSDHGQY